MTQPDSVYRALLIEDDPRQAEVIGDLLKEIGDFRIDLMGGSDNAIDWLSRVDYPLVVLGTEPEGASSLLETLERIKRAKPMTAVIVLSSESSIEQAVAVMRMGADDYLQRPVEPSQFQFAVKRALDRKAIYGESQDASGLLDLMVSCQLISGSLDEIHVLGLIKGYLMRSTASDFSAVYLRKEGKIVPIDLSDQGTGESKDQTLGEVLEITLQAMNPFSGWDSGQSGFRVLERGQLTPGLFVYRFEFVRGEEYFVACLSPRLKTSIEDFESRLRLFHAQIDVTSRNIERYRGVQRLAYVDDATGLYNTRYLNDLLEKQIELAKQSGTSFAVLFMDVDHFKQVNDGHGHLVGTKILNELGKKLRRYVRETDTVFRYGGDEFIAVLSPSDLPTAQTVAERIRVAVEKNVFVKRENLNLKLTVSIGVAVFPDHADSKRTIMDAADHAMYTAKRSSRNAVYVAELMKPGLVTVPDGVREERRKKSVKP